MHLLLKSERSPAVHVCIRLSDSGFASHQTTSPPQNDRYVLMVSRAVSYLRRNGCARVALSRASIPSEAEKVAARVDHKKVEGGQLGCLVEWVERCSSILYSQVLTHSTSAQASSSTPSRCPNPSKLEVSTSCKTCPSSKT